MRLSHSAGYRCAPLILPFMLMAWFAPTARAQSQAGFAISGIVSDPSGGSTPGITVALTPAMGGTSQKVATDANGGFRFRGVKAGRYFVDVQLKGFQPEHIDVTVTGQSPEPLTISLRLAGVREEITVKETTDTVNTESSGNLDTVTLDRNSLDNLPIFDQDYVAAMSRFLDPGAVGTGGATLVVNGMEQTGIGVSASAIQQVKINQNPYSAEFSRPGRGRIEIITKPGTAEFHGTFNFLFRDYRLNARDPFALTRPTDQRRTYEGSLTGPLGRDGKTSFVISANRQEQDLVAVVFASTPAGIDRENVPAPQRTTDFSGNLNRQINENHLFSITGTYHDATSLNQGIGGFVLPQAGSNLEDREDSLYYNDVLTVSPKLVNQYRVYVARQHTPTTSLNKDPETVVLGAFTTGGAQADRLQTENHITFNDILSWSHGKHDIRTGINVPDISRRGLDDFTGFGGVYTYSSLQDYLHNRPFSLVQQQGNGHVVFIEVVLGAFFQDEYHIRRDLTIALGVRYDWQNYLHDNDNFSPRLSLAWSPDRSHRTVLRTGAGFFYDRTGPGPIFDLERYNGLRLRQIVLTNPLPPGTFDPALLAAQPVSLTRLDPTVKIPYTAQFSFGVEHQLGKSVTLSVSYWGTRGVSLFRSRDVNAPPPPEYLARPDPAFGVYRQIESSGHLQNDSMEISFRGNLTRHFSGMMQYNLGRSYSDVAGNNSLGTRSSGINTFPANNYDLSGEWARADFDQRHRLSMLGTFHAARFLDFGLGFFANTGMPYSETTGRDDNHDGLASDRPVGVRRNTLQGPAYIDLDLRWSHDFLLRPAKKDGPRLTTAIDAFNATNKVNYQSYVGSLSSPFFGQAVAAMPPRRLQLSLRFSF